MAKAKKVVAKVEPETDEDDVQVESAADEGLSNGLGLEKFLTSSPKPAPKGTEKPVQAAAETVEGKTDTTDTPDEKKDTPAKDPKTGRFLPKVKAQDTAVEDAQDGDDVAALKKRLKDTRDWASQVNQRNQALDTQLKKLQADFETVKAKMDGTYVEPDHAAVDPVDLAKLNERARISRTLAEAKYGKDAVQEWIYAEGSPYTQLEQMDPMVKAKVFGAEQPVMEAIKQLKWAQFYAKYTDDPDVAVDRLTEEIKAEFAHVLKQTSQRKRTIEDVNGLTHVGGTGEEGDSHLPKRSGVVLNKVFGNFPTGYN